MFRAPRTACTRRTPAGLVAALCVVVQLLALAHGCLVAHVRCQEHGAWEHADITHAVHSVVSAGSWTQSREAGVHAATPSDEHGHEACSACADRRVLPALAWFRSAELPSVADRADVPVPPATDLPVQRLYALAPKTSPPS